MISNCPHCKKELNLSSVHKSKIEAAVLKQPGKPLKFSCPNCKKPIEISSKDIDQGGKNKKPVNEQKEPNRKKNNQSVQPEGSIESNSEGKSTEANETRESPKQEGVPPKKKNAPELPKPVNPPPPPPEPPDISWLKSGKLDEKEVIEDIPTAIIMMPEGRARDSVAETMEEFNYQLFFPKDAAQVIGKMRFKDFAAAVYHPAFEGTSLAESRFHKHISNLPMVKRRYMFYILIGPEFQTLYDLEALAYSANIVVNEAESDNVNIILKKARNDYDTLFGPFINILKAHGKR